MIERIRRRFETRTAAEVVRDLSLRVWPVSTVTHAYYGLRFWPPVWKGIINRQAREAYRQRRESLDDVQRRLVRELATDGIASIHIDELLQDGDAFATLLRSAEPILDRPSVKRQVETGVSEGRRGKYFVIRALDDHPVMDLENPLLALPINARLLGVVNGYLGMFSRLKSMDLWINLPDSRPAAGSQLWHRDYEDRNLVKIFLYLTDVDEGSGPLSFVKTSQIGGALGHIFPRNPPIGVVPAMGAVEQQVSPQLLASCTVPRGTLVFCDTSGLHKGGRCTESRRIAFTATFGTQAAIDRDRYSVPEGAIGEALSPAARHALGIA